jgi:hypothetical protein
MTMSAVIWIESVFKFAHLSLIIARFGIFIHLDVLLPVWHDPTSLIRFEITVIAK